MKHEMPNFAKTATVALGFSGAFALPEHIIQTLSNQGLSMDEITKLERHDPRLIEAINSYRYSPLTQEYTELAKKRSSDAPQATRLENLVEYFLYELEEYGYSSVINPENDSWIVAQSKAEEIIYPALTAGHDYHFFYQEHLASEGIPMGKAQKRFEDIIDFFNQYQAGIRRYWECDRRMEEILGIINLGNLSWCEGVKSYHIPDDFSLWVYYPNFMRYEVVKNPATRREHANWYIVNCPEIVSYFMTSGNLSGMNKYNDLLVQLSELFAKCGYNALDEANELVKAFCNDENCFGKEKLGAA